MKNCLPIYGHIPTSFKCQEVYDPNSTEEYEDDDDLFADIDSPQIIVKNTYPPRPMEFSIPTYSSRENKEAITYNEFYTKIFFLPPEAQIVIVRYDDQSNLFHIDPTEVVSLINVSETGSSIDFYSMWYNVAKLIEIGQLQSATITDDKGDFRILAKRNGTPLQLSPHIPLHLNGKINGISPIIDVVHFSGQTEYSDERNLYIGLVIP